MAVLRHLVCNSVCLYAGISDTKPHCVQRHTEHLHNSCLHMSMHDSRAVIFWKTLLRIIVATCVLTYDICSDVASYACLSMFM